MTIGNDRLSRLFRAGRAIALALPLVGLALPALADGAAQNLAARHLEAGTLAAGATELSAIVAADPANDDARLGLGVVQFVGAVETLSEGLYRYGLKPPQSFLVPVVRLPVPENPAPESITYADFRGLIETFVNDVGTAEKTLAGVKASDVRLVLDLAKVRYDANGDGTIADDERFVAVIQRVTGMNPGDMPSSLSFAFDRGDALWLQGYCNVLMAFGDFLLAHDWHESFDVTFHHFFPQSKSAFAAALAPNVGSMYDEAAPVADLISFVHVRWPVADAARMKSSLAHLKQVDRAQPGELGCDRGRDRQRPRMAAQSAPDRPVRQRRGQSGDGRVMAPRPRRGRRHPRRQEARPALALPAGVQSAARSSRSRSPSTSSCG